jgi:hypothetical protein
MPTYLAPDLVGSLIPLTDNQGQYAIFQTTCVPTRATKFISYTYLFQNVAMK